MEAIAVSKGARLDDNLPDLLFEPAHGVEVTTLERVCFPCQEPGLDGGEREIPLEAGVARAGKGPEVLYRARHLPSARPGQRARPSVVMGHRNLPAGRRCEQAAHLMAQPCQARVGATADPVRIADERRARGAADGGR